MITVFYDGKCGLCSKEIKYYRSIAPEGIFDWQDITQNAEDLENAGVTVAEGLKFLHVKDFEGKMHIGVDAFILIWKQLNRWRMLANVVALPGIRQVVDATYRLFALRRFKRLAYCQVAKK